MKKILTVFLFMTLYLSPSYAAVIGESNAGDVAKNPAEDDSKRVHLQLNPEAVAIVGPTSLSQGAGFGGAVIYGVTPYFGFGGGLRQAFTADHLARSAFTQLDIRFVVAYNGGLVFENLDALKAASKNKLGGLRTQVFISNYFFTKEVAPYTGLGLGSTYEISASKRVNYFIGGRVDRITNASVTLYPIQALAGIAFRL